MRTPILLIRLIGLLLCGVSMMLALATPASAPGQPALVLLSVLIPKLTPGTLAALSLATPVAIGTTFWYCTSFPDFENTSRRIVTFLALQTVLALLVAPELQFVIAVEAGLLLTPRNGSLWVFGQASLIWFSSIVYPQLMSWVIPATTDRFHRFIGIGLFMLLAMLYNFFAFALGWLSATERRQSRALDLTNRSLEQTNAELRTAQHAAAKSARLEERLSIARELHDAIGHQLTGLSVNLQVASHLSRDGAKEHVQEAYKLAGELLGEVRSVVSAIREPYSMDFSSSLQAFALRLERPKVHLSLASLPESLAPEMQHALLRCAQEIITNAVRHADARNLWIDTQLSGNAYELHARDDGHGRQGVVPGNGLTGITERIRALHGVTSFETEPQRGFRVTIRLPLLPEGTHGD